MTTKVEEQIREDMKLDLRIKYKILIKKIKELRGNPNCQFNLAMDNAKRIGKIDFLLKLSEVNTISWLTKEEEKEDKKVKKKFINSYSSWGYGIKGTPKMKQNAFICLYKNGWNMMRDNINNSKVFSDAIIPDASIGRCTSEKNWIREVRQLCN